MHEQRPEQDAQQQESQWESHLEQRLQTYYGPPLKEQPLAQAAWQNLQQKLGSQQQPPEQNDWKHLFRRRSSEPVPEYVRTAFMHVAYEARIHHPLPALYCSFKKGVEPTVYTVPGVKPRLYLILPSSAMTGMDEAGLDTLLATGLARHRLTLRWPAPLLYVLCLSPALLGLLLLVFCRGLYLMLGFVLFVLLFLLSWLLLKRLRRNVYLSADALAVQWLGRVRICQGLHRLADYQRVLFTVSAHNRWKKWSTPSLTERIERVCGTHVGVYDERLTLVR